MAARWVLLPMLALAAAGCPDDRIGDFPVDTGVVDTDSGESDCLLLDADQLLFEEGPVEVLSLQNACPHELGVDLVLDDPDGAFEVRLDGTLATRVTMLEWKVVELEVEHVAEGPGIYEAQLSFEDGPRDYGSVQLYAEVPE